MTKPRKSLSTINKSKNSTIRACKNIVGSYCEQMASPDFSPQSTVTPLTHLPSKRRIPVVSQHLTGSQPLQEENIALEDIISRQINIQFSEQFEKFGVMLKEMEVRITTEMKNKISKLTEELKTEFNTKIIKLDEKLTNKQKDMKREYDNKISDMQTCFDRNLEEQKNLNKQLASKVEKCNMVNTILDKELYRIKKYEAERLSHNLLLSGPLVSSAIESQDIKQAAINLIAEHTKFPLHLDRHATQVSSAETFGRKPKPGSRDPDNRGILLKFHAKETKMEVVSFNLQNRTNGFYINEQLTPEVNDLYREVRKLKKDNPTKIAVLHTRDGIIRVKKTRTGVQNDILTQADLERFKTNIGLSANN